MADAANGGAGDNGFLQRFQLLVWPDVAREWEEIDRQTDVRAERRIEDLADRILLLSPEDPLRTRLSPEAQERLGTWRRELEQKVRSGALSPGLESHLAKSRSLLPKLALIFHLADSRKPARCQLMTVSGFRITSTSLQRDQNWRSAVQNSRSKQFNTGRGRLRLSTAICCRSARTSRAVSLRLWQKTRTTASKD